MSKFTTIKVTGLKDLENALKELDHDLHKKSLRAAGKSAMEPVAQRVRNYVPLDTGGLRATIRTTVATTPRRLKKYGRRAGMVASVSAGRGSRKHGVTGHQALNIEYGNARTQARPFMRPAIQGKERSTILRFRVSLRQSIAKTVKTQYRRDLRKFNK